jgi:hypothetical protein
LIQKRYGSAERIRVMDRGIPTEAVPAGLRASDSKVSHLVGTPQGRLTKLEKKLAEKPWQQVREQLRVKLLPQAGEVHVLAERGARDRAGRAVAALVKTTVDAEGKLTFTLDRAKLRTRRSREGRYLLRTNLSADNPELIWRSYA